MLIHLVGHLLLSILLTVGVLHCCRKKAYIELGSVEEVKQAVLNLNQTMFQGLRLKVDVPFNMPKLREAVLGCDKVPTATGGLLLVILLPVNHVGTSGEAECGTENFSTTTSKIEIRTN